MSRMEYNKGKLIPVNINVGSLDWEELDELLEQDIHIIDGVAYSVEWEAQGEELYSIEKATRNENGTIDFETYHYNGGGHWTEVVESALKNGS